MKLSLDQFWLSDTKQVGLAVFPGKYQITTEFEGRGPQTGNIDMSGIKLIKFWLGKLQSNILEVEW